MANALLSAAGRKLSLEVRGASWSWPRSTGALRVGEEVLVFADLPENRPFEVLIGGRSISPHTSSETTRHTSFEPFLRRAVARAKVRQLEGKLKNARGAERSRISDRLVNLARDHRVLAPGTGLLVLETEEDYERYNIPRDALADILTINNEGLHILAGKERSKGLAAFSRDEDAKDKGTGDEGDFDSGEIEAASERREAKSEAAPPSPGRNRFGIRGPSDTESGDSGAPAEHRFAEGSPGARRFASWSQ